MRIFFALLLLAVLLYDCKKGDNSLQQGITYHKSRTNGLAIRVFANSGEITDATIVNRFTQLDSAEITRLTSYMGTLDTIQIVDGANARLFESGKFSDFSYAGISKDFNFFNKDTIYGYTYGEVYTRTMYYYLSLYKPVVYSETITSSTAGNYQFLYKGRKEYIIEKSDDHLAAPWIVFNHHYSNGSSSYYVQNKLDKNFYKFLQPQDTMVLREYTISYE